MLILSVCQLIPIVGPMVMWGYVFEVIEARHRHGAQEYPPFDFDRLGVYLTRGVWPFLILLVVVAACLLVALPILFLSMIPAVTGNPSSQPSQFAFVIGIIAFMVLMFAVQILMAPLLLRAGLSQDFASAFSLPYLKDFLSRVGMELVLSFLFLLITAPFIAALGILALCIGIYAAIHLYYQLYELYLARGGTPIPLKTH
jgi:hypothetical protein